MVLREIRWAFLKPVKMCDNATQNLVIRENQYETPFEAIPLLNDFRPDSMWLYWLC